MENILPPQVQAQITALYRQLITARTPQSTIRHPGKPHPLFGRKFQRTFSLFLACLLIESVILQIITSTPVEQPQTLAQTTASSTGQVATTDNHQPTTQSNLRPLLNTQVQAASIAPTPLPTPTPFTSPLRRYTLTQYYSNHHPAIDMAAPYGTPIYAINSGTVLATGYILAGGGLMVQIQHRDGYVSYYAHLSSIQAVKGQTVNAQTQIGRIGSTGWSTGPHLHLMIQKNGQSLNPLAIIK